MRQANTDLHTATLPARPNILLIMADELVPFLTGAYGHPVVRTPHLDELVRRGVRFDAAYSPAPLCAPARACLISGQYTASNRVYDNAALFAADTPAVGHYLTLAGYDCVLSGKMHFVGPDQLHGFRCRLTTDIYPEEFTWLGRRTPWALARDPSAFDPDQVTRDHARNYVGEEVHVGRWHHHLAYDEEAHFRAVQYLRARSVVRDQPFFLCVSYHHPHEPFWPPQDLWDLYEGAEIEVPSFPANLEGSYSAMDRWLNALHNVRSYPQLRDHESISRVRRAYYALVTYVDRKVGELLGTLREHGLWDNTAVVFTSDHGDMLCEKGMVQKRAFYEWSARVPLLLRLPGDQYAGRRVAAPVSLVDILPTFQDLAGVPAEDRLPADGASLLGLLEGTNDPDRTVYAEMHLEDTPVPCFMARRGRYKYIHIHGVDTQLFDLATDPGEWRNLAGLPQYQAVEEALRTALLQRFQVDAIEHDVRRTIASRLLIDRAMRRTRTLWDYAPQFDPNQDALRQYLPACVAGPEQRG